MQRGKKHGEGALESYIDALSRLKSSGSLTKEGMERIAREIGFSTDDFVMAKAQAAKHATRARKYLERGLYESARKETEAALALEPLSTEYRLLAARAIAGLYEREGAQKRRDEAAAILRELIAERPELDEAYDLMARLERDRALERLEIRQAPRRDRSSLGGRGREPARARAAGKGGKALAAIATVACFGIIAAIAITERSAGDADAEPAQAVEAPAAIAAHAPPALLPTERAIPVTLSDELAAAYPIRIADSRFIPYKDAWSYKLSAMASSRSLELAELKLDCKGYGSDGGIVFSRVANALQGIDAALRPGELAPFDLSVYEKEEAPDLARVSLGVSFSKTAYTPASYAEEPPLALSWDMPPPAGMGLEARLRSDASNASYSVITFALRNSGSREIKLLKLRMEWLAGTRVVDSYSALQLVEWRAPMLPGDVVPRVFRRSIAKGSYDSWRLSVEEIR
jgi:hypothetical protein